MLKEWGFGVSSADNYPIYQLDIWCDAMTWKFTPLPRRPFYVITMIPPCTELSNAKTVGTRELVGSIAVAKRSWEIIRYFRPARWWLDTTRFGILPQQDPMQVIPFLDVYYCQYWDGEFPKSTRVYGSLYILAFTTASCDGGHCKILCQGAEGFSSFGCPFGSALRNLTYLIPEKIL